MKNVSFAVILAAYDVRKLRFLKKLAQSESTERDGDSTGNSTVYGTT